MLSAMALAILPLLDGASDPVPADSEVKAGWTAALVFVGLVLAVVLLAFSFAKQLRKTRAARDAGVFGDAPAATPEEDAAADEPHENRA
jgi:hypothetical protein